MKIDEILKKAAELGGKCEKKKVFRHLDQIVTECEAVFDPSSQREPNRFYTYIEPLCYKCWKYDTYTIGFMFKETDPEIDRKDFEPASSLKS